MEENTNQTLRALLESVLLRYPSVVEIVAEYSGDGDSGSISEVRFAETSQSWEGIDVDEDTQSKIEDACYPLLSRHYPGWEINEGSSGTITFNLETFSFEISHGRRIVNYDSASGEV